MIPRLIGFSGVDTLKYPQNVGRGILERIGIAVVSGVCYTGTRTWRCVHEHGLAVFFLGIGCVSAAELYDAS